MARHAHAITQHALGRTSGGLLGHFGFTYHPAWQLTVNLLAWAALLLGFYVLLRLGAPAAVRPLRPGPGGFHPENRATAESDIARSDWSDYSARLH